MAHYSNYHQGIEMKFSQKYSLFFFLIFLLYVCALPQTAFSRPYALLVGVSEYPSLPEYRWLTGPQNDVQLLAEILRQRGFSAENITILADGVKNAQLPTRKAILQHLFDLGNVVEKGDFVFLHFSGHGSRQPQASNSKSGLEADGLDEIFLPRDIGQWELKTGQVKNSITDDEIGNAVQLLRKKGAFVWAVFDSCHSGSMLRGAPAEDIRYRKIAPSELGIPTITSTANSSHVPQTVKEEIDPSLGGYVAFYAAQPQEQTQEKHLPPGKQNSKTYGLFSYTIAKILSSNHPMTYRQAAQRILQSYTADNIRMLTPLFEGSHLDAPLFGNANSTPVRQWPIEAKSKKWKIKAGNLHGIEDGSLFAILNSPSDKNTEALGYAVIQHTTLTRGQLEPVAHGHLAKLNIEDVSRDAYARLITPKVNFQITVARPQALQGNGQQAVDDEKRIEKITKLPQGKGITINWVDAGKEADIRLGFSPADQPQCPLNTLWFLPPSGELICNGRQKSMSIILDKNQAELKAALYKNLRSMGKVINLLRQAESLTGNSNGPKIDLRFFLTRKGTRNETIISPEQYPDFKEGDHIRVAATNKADSPVDLTLLFVDSRYGIRAVYPTAVGESNRIQPGDNIPNVIESDITTETIGTERLIAIAVVAADRSPRADFSFLAQETLPRTREEDSRLKNCSDEQCFLEEWFIEAGFGVAPLQTREKRRARSRRAETNMTMFSWNVGR